jgi:hypothetical protein
VAKTKKKTKKEEASDSVTNAQEAMKGLADIPIKKILAPATNTAMLTDKGAVDPSYTGAQFEKLNALIKLTGEPLRNETATLVLMGYHMGYRQALVDQNIIDVSNSPMWEVEQAYAQKLAKKEKTK